MLLYAAPPDKPVYMRPLTFRWITHRMGADPFPTETNPDRYNVEDTGTWCLNTWPENRIWLAPYLAWVLFVNICNIANPS